MGAIGVLGVVAIGLVDLVGAPTGAQSADVGAELVSIDAASVPLSGASTNPSISDAGDVVVFTNESMVLGEPAEYDLVVRKQVVGEETAEVLLIDLNSPQPVAAAVSGDGCTLGYSVLADRPVVDPPVDPPVEGSGVSEVALDAEDVGGVPLDPEMIELRTLELCPSTGVEPATAVLDRVEGAAPLSAPALSSDGTTIAWSTGVSVLAYASTSTPEMPDVVEMVAPGVDFVIGPHLDISADGSTIVFESGPLTIDPDDAGEPDDAAIDRGDAGDAGDAVAVTGISSSVFITTITRTSTDAEDIADAAPIVTTELFAPSEAGSSWPTISGDGSIVVYHSDQPLPIDGVPADGDYLVIADRTVSPVAHRVLTTGAVRPDLAGDGSAVVYDVFGSVQLRRSDSAAPFEEFTERVVNPKIDVDFEEGAAASVTGAVVSADGGRVIFDQPAGVQLSAPILVDAHVWSQDAAPLFAPPPTSTTIDNTTTTTIAVTQPTVSVPTTTRSTPRTTPRTTPRRTTRPTAPPTTTATLPVTFDPAAFEFAPTIVKHGQRTASVDLFNPTSGNVTVISVIVDAPDAADFLIDPSACATLASGERCAVGVTFAPTIAGERTANVVATMSDGTTSTVSLRGVGAPAPTMSVQPGVASNGQVVTVFGSGFPAGASIQFDWNNGQVQSIIVIDDLGGFAEPLIILPNTASGPVNITVAGQVDLFGEVRTTVLVSGSSTRGNTAVFGSGIVSGALRR